MFQTHRHKKKEATKGWKSASVCDPCAGSVWESTLEPFWVDFGAHLGAMLAPKSGKCGSGRGSENRSQKKTFPSHARQTGETRETGAGGSALNNPAFHVPTADRWQASTPLRALRHGGGYQGVDLVVTCRALGTTQNQVVVRENQCRLVKCLFFQSIATTSDLL